MPNQAQERLVIFRQEWLSPKIFYPAKSFIRVLNPFVIFFEKFQILLRDQAEAEAIVIHGSFVTFQLDQEQKKNKNEQKWKQKQKMKQNRLQPD